MRSKEELLVRLGKLRWKKKLSRKNKNSNSPYSNIQTKIFKNALRNDQHILKINQSKLYEYLLSVGFIEFFDEIKEKITIPANFSIEENNIIFRRTIGELIHSIFNKPNKEITLDFSQCKKTDEPTIFFLNIILMEVKQYYKNLNNKLVIKDKILRLHLIKSQDNKVNRLLFLYKNIKDFDFDNFDFQSDDIPYKHLGYLKGEKAQKHYLENKKNFFTTQIVEYLNACLEVSNYNFSPTGRNELEGIISEVLNNAEDHSPMNTYYVTSTFSLNIAEKKEDLVGVLNINFLNFGYSFHDGLEQNKESNYEIYKILEEKSKSENFKSFTKEEIFTLLALQDGISRLKFTDESRGTGTMKFITCFMNFGDFEDPSKNFIPHLKIFSGRTLVVCNKKYKPYLKDDRYCLSLNAENDLNFKPDKNNLKSLETNFPGTMISVKVYLNENNLNTKAEKNDD